jgi:Fic family protein
MRYIPRQLANEIKEKAEIAKQMDSSRAIGKCRRIRQEIIEKNSQVQSYRIEHPDSILPYSVSRNRRNRTIKNGVRNLADSFEWGVQNFNPEEFEESFIREIAGRVLPEIFPAKIAHYREGTIRIIGASHLPPHASKVKHYEIPSFVEEMRKQLKYTDIINRIEAAAYAHLHLVRIHPFPDGNGRTARTLQNVVLDYFGIPLPIIYVGERNTYYDLLDKAVVGWLDDKANGVVSKRVSEGEEMFYTYIAGKVNMSYDDLIEHCHK